MIHARCGTQFSAVVPDSAARCRADDTAGGHWMTHAQIGGALFQWCYVTRLSTVLEKSLL